MTACLPACGQTQFQELHHSMKGLQNPARDCVANIACQSVKRLKALLCLLPSDYLSEIICSQSPRLLMTNLPVLIQ